MESRRMENVSDQQRVVSDRVPPWVESIGAPVWVCDLNHKIVYINPRAEELLARPADTCIGHNCYEVTRGKLPNGKSFCNARCDIVRGFHYGNELEPVRLRVGIGRRSKWVEIVVIAARASDLSGTTLVHCVFENEREQRFKQYLTKVMSRASGSRRVTHDLGAFRLTAREREILELLADDRSLHDISEKLHVSHTTVRNHVQHIISKLGVHSITEAVAFYVLSHD
jgi:DNA-binding CsgD family transcriptional regulator